MCCRRTQGDKHSRLRASPTDRNALPGARPVADSGCPGRRSPRPRPGDLHIHT
jgi:hypothetical protein